MFESMLNNLTWNEEFVEFKDATEAHKCFKFMREAIMDAHLPVCKVSGFLITDNITDVPATEARESHSKGFRITRSKYVSESYIEIANNLKHVFFPEVYKSQKYNIIVDIVEPFNFDKGIIYDGLWAENRYDRVTPAITPQKHICYFNERPSHSGIMLMLSYNSGYYTAKEAVKLLPREMHSAFPMPVSFDINEFVRILPVFNDNKVRYVLKHKMTHKWLKEHFEAFVNKLNTNPSKEELLWVQHLLH